MSLNPKDITIECYPSIPANGGMYTGQMPVGVIITHMPTGLIVKCHSERSQHKNKLIALERLEKLLEERLDEN